MAAEGHCYSGSPKSCVCVNGAATGWPRKGGRTRRTGDGSPGVNGAATGWPRKVLHATAAEPVQLERQWGRDRLAAEGRA